MGRVEQRRAGAAETEGHRELLADRVVGRLLRDGTEVLTQRGGEAGVVAPGEKHVLGVVVEPRELAHEVADVRADAEVVQLAHVDRDSHHL